MNPYLVLGVAPDADDAAIRRAYLDAIKLAPPEHQPKRFQALNAAYEQIKDEASRHGHVLFHQEPPGETPLDAFVRTLRLRPARPLPLDTMKEFLRSCAK